jgi:flagellar basal-body rod modification protein FlgD
MSISANDTLNQLQNNTNLINYKNGRNTLGTGKLDRQGFVQLILAQLQYQDPTNPQDSTQMLSQQLQLEQADQMKDIVNATKFSQAGSMVGKQATIVDAPWDFTNNVSGQPTIDLKTNKPATVSGTINSVQFDAAHAKALVNIGGTYYDAEKILNLSLPPAISSNPGGTTPTTTGSGH